ncbi:GT2 family glycosyltransferase [Clostridium saccharoperbutylacetonicum]|uniref:Putative glycosyltransferase n=2 Tax=Clostridium saccharoperbutylacetonicum TaxID=36745 RepID=M1MTV3_9CLOT|nr:glycosyltransferase [Clostridium saccharoperbutylacetonicum]AGF54982.1 putative glycosyltransferase [Clostridium saccharoperbutylacetonicum N1-4(HMT)]NRT64311.1 GT2 family glycosyltransferase [Clostridium saccharoperbutylacetonicum]NSB27680.1 GT2 family glycosyltransferase [Clostridium saccharoperbutylacetonicum]NSB41167.1 GT2 family glycosyltransferase [Clostridium saccharoperbutylacetonicum]
MDNVVIILNYNDYRTTCNLINKIKNYLEIDKIVVIDNKSTNDSLKILKKYISEKIHVIESEDNKGYAYGNNVGIRYAIQKFNTEYITIANPDVIFENSTIREMKKFLKQNLDVAAVNTKIKNIKGQYEPGGTNIPTIKEDFKSMFLLNEIFKKKEINNFNEEYVNYQILFGCFFMIRSKVIEQIGMFDERTFLFGEERILGYKIKSIGMRQVTLNNLECIHEHSKSINKNISNLASKYKILYDSRLIYYKEYLNINKLSLYMFYILRSMSLGEKYIYVLVKNLIH